MWRNQQPQHAAITMSSNNESEWLAETFSEPYLDVQSIHNNGKNNLMFICALKRNAIGTFLLQ